MNFMDFFWISLKSFFNTCIFIFSYFFARYISNISVQPAICLVIQNKCDSFYILIIFLIECYKFSNAFFKTFSFFFAKDLFGVIFINAMMVWKKVQTSIVINISFLIFPPESRCTRQQHHMQLMKDTNKI